MITRNLHINLPKGQSAFLWGARKTGKTTLLRTRFPHSIVFDFLRTDLFLEVNKRPAILRERLLAADRNALQQPIILDEVQKAPGVLDEVHWLIENEGLQFILCGSSARKLKRGQANLLGGRAWRFELHPLTSAEIGELDLLRALNQGLIPAHYEPDSYQKSLTAYVQDYLKEEVFDEGLTRNIPAFTRFFDALGYSHGELTNFAKIARDCGVDAKTVRGYYEIVADTLLGRWVEPFRRRSSRQSITQAAKFYLIDVGVAGRIQHRRIEEERGTEFGKAFEHFIFMELVAYLSYADLELPIRFWRTKSGLEVDFIIGDADLAIEVKSTHRVDTKELNSLAAFAESFQTKRCLIVTNEPAPRRVKEIDLIPWREFLRRLWAGEFLA